MGLNFPAAPLVGDVYPTPALPGVPQWTWNGTSWKCGTIDTANYIRRSGDTMTGPLVLAADPATAMQAATKQYGDMIAGINLALNGFMDVSQENAVVTNLSLASGQYPADQWLMQSSVSTFTTSNGNVGAALPGIDRTLGIVSPAGHAPVATHLHYLIQKIEGLRFGKMGWGMGAGSTQSLAVGFFCYSNAGGVMTVGMRNNDATRSCCIPITVPATQWVYRTAVFPPCLDGTWKIDNTSAADLLFSWSPTTGVIAPSAGVWANGNYVAAPTATNMFTAGGQGCYVTGVTAIPGINPVPQAMCPVFRRSYQEELLLCARYWAWNRYGEIGHGLSATVMNFTHTPLVPYRVSPTLSCLTPIYTESVPWSVANTVNSASVNGGHCSSSGADYQVTGTFQNATAANSMVGIYQQAVKFNARM